MPTVRRIRVRSKGGDMTVCRDLLMGQRHFITIPNNQDGVMLSSDDADYVLATYPESVERITRTNRTKT